MNVGLLNVNLCYSYVKSKRLAALYDFSPPPKSGVHNIILTIEPQNCDTDRAPPPLFHTDLSLWMFLLLIFVVCDAGLHKDVPGIKIITRF